jgi:hypothetical protein
MQNNPKDTIGSTKVPISVIPGTVITELALGLAEGAIKYGKYNWRAVGVRYSIYYDATMRHLISHFEGEDLDPDTGLNHITKAISSLTVLRDAMIQGKWTDDRPLASKEGNPINSANSAFKVVQGKHKDCELHYDRESIHLREAASQTEEFHTDFQSAISYALEIKKQKEAAALASSPLGDFDEDF